MMRELRGGLLVVVGVLLGWFLFDESPTAAPAPSGDDGAAIVAAIESLERSLESLAPVRDARAASGLDLPARRPASTTGERQNLDQLIAALDTTNERITALLRQQSSTAHSPELRVSSRPSDDRSILDTLVAASSAGEADQIVTRDWLLRSVNELVEVFGRPQSISTNPDGEYWYYETRDPRTSEVENLGFKVSQSGYVIRADAAQIDR
ncbi:MAG: hypothetical protein AAF196_14790 [Planctomycetota bacterium]